MFRWKYALRREGNLRVATRMCSFLSVSPSSRSILPPSSPSLSLCALTKAGDTNAYACLGITHPPCNAFQTRGGQFKDTIQSIKHIIIYLQRAPAQSLLNYWLTLSPGIAGKSNISNIIFLTFSSFRPPRYILGGLLGRRLRVALR